MRGFILNFDMKNLSLESGLQNGLLKRIVLFKTVYLVNKHNSLVILCPIRSGLQ